LLLLGSFINKLSAESYTVGSVAEMNGLMHKVQPGDVIIWKDGAYADVKINFQPKQNGKAGLLIVLKAQTAGKVLFTGNSQLLVNGEYLLAEGFLFEGVSSLEKGDVMAFGASSTHCRITNCAVVNYTPADVMVNNNWISLQGFYNEVDHCYFTGKTNQGPYLVVRYKTDKDFEDGSDKAPSTYHHIHHNFFGYRTLPTDNGGEDMRIGDSKTSFTHGFNMIEYNYFEEHRLEAEVISNKSWNNIYRFNSFTNNDGALVLRHGQQCIVYGNYFNGKSGRNTSGGIRIINADQTVFNNYLENLEGGKGNMKSPITIMSGLEGSALNEYYPANNAVVVYNTIVNAVGPVINAGVGNKSKGKPFVAPQNILLVGNLVINTIGENTSPFVVADPKTGYRSVNNYFTNGTTTEQGFVMVKAKKIVTKDGFKCIQQSVDKTIVSKINERLALHHIKLTETEITKFNPKWKLKKEAVGVTWIK
jgi:poly(beta-D-mannuronate) lyase